jgi:hypothetical protein
MPHRESDPLATLRKIGVFVCSGRVFEQFATAKLLNSSPGSPHSGKVGPDSPDLVRCGDTPDPPQMFSASAERLDEITEALDLLGAPVSEDSITVYASMTDEQWAACRDAFLAGRIAARLARPLLEDAERRAAEHRGGGVDAREKRLARRNRRPAPSTRATISAPPSSVQGAKRLRDAAWDASLPHSLKMLLVVLADIADEAGQCSPPVTALCRRLAWSDRTVQASLSELVKRGYIRREFRRARPTIYTIADQAEWPKDGQGVARAR